MDTRLLNAFVVLAETEHFGEASSRLFISQPALTKQIKTLESQLGVTLFQRGCHSFSAWVSLFFSVGVTAQN
nr:LysR family transcriptional regulator [Proteus terrae]